MDALNILMDRWWPDSAPSSVGGGHPPEDRYGAPVTDPAQTALDELLAVLDLEEAGTADVNITTTAMSSSGGKVSVPATFAEEMTLFLGQSQKMPHGRVFGGRVLAQGGCVWPHRHVRRG